MKGPTGMVGPDGNRGPPGPLGAVGPVGFPVSAQVTRILICGLICPLHVIARIIDMPKRVFVFTT